MCRPSCTAVQSGQQLCNVSIHKLKSRYESDFADSIKLQKSSIAVNILKWGLHLFSVPNLEIRFTGLKLGCKGQGPILMCEHQVPKALYTYAILILIIILQCFVGRLCHN